MPESLTARSAMLAVETNLFPLYEIIDGTEYRITHDPKGLPVMEYLKIQGRYRHLTDEAIEGIQKEADGQWKRLLAQAKGCP
jgi:pyruvate/2-oxoacid:ferredoxin oxidoreductase beta subunit